MPAGLFRYIATTSWTHQFVLAAVSISVFLFEVAPLELQRRVVNDLVKHRHYDAVILLCAAYAGAILAQGMAKLGLNVYRSWVGERAKRDLRRRICSTVGGVGRSSAVRNTQGAAASMIVAEVEPIGGFVGSSISEPLLQAGILAAVIAYIIHLDPLMGAAALALFVPQVVFVPLLQRAMNRRTGARVWLLRQIGAAVVGRARDQPCLRADAARIDRVFRVNMQIVKLKFTMNFLMNLCSHLQIIGALLLGGWWVLHSQLEIGGVVALISGVGRLNDPWGDLINYFREASVTSVKFNLLANTVNQFIAEPADEDERRIDRQLLGRHAG